MGIYTIPCGICKKEFMWFSGSKSQTCTECLEKFTYENGVKDGIAEANKSLRARDSCIETLQAEKTYLEQKLQSAKETLERIYNRRMSVYASMSDMCSDQIKEAGDWLKNNHSEYTLEDKK